MADNQRIEDLRSRVQKDPASIAFAQLAEELRRAGQLQEAVDACRAGLAIHPSYLSARVTLGRALLELGEIDQAAEELGVVLKSAPENLAAMRAMGEIHLRRGHDAEALAQLRAALAIARNDPDLEETVADLARKIEPKDRSTAADELTQHEFLQHLPPPPVAPKPAHPAPAPDTQQLEPGTQHPAPSPPEVAPVVRSEPMPTPVPAENPQADPARERAIRTVAALEEWLDAVHVARADRSA